MLNVNFFKGHGRAIVVVFFYSYGVKCKLSLVCSPVVEMKGAGISMEYI